LQRPHSPAPAGVGIFVLNHSELETVSRTFKEGTFHFQCFPSLALVSAIGAVQRRSQSGRFDVVGVFFQRSQRDSDILSLARRGRGKIREREAMVSAQGGQGKRELHFF
jgi:hypothetical protein